MKYIIGVLCLMLAISCTKDKGNYNYKELNEVIIEGVEDAYYFTLNRIGTIRPKLSFTQSAQEDLGKYKYQWVIDKASGYSISLSYLSLKKDLDTLIKPALGSASYYCYFRVTDTTTGIYSQKDFMMHVSTPSYEGWMMLCEPSPGKSRLDMVSLVSDKSTFYKDLLTIVGSDYKLEGAPAFIASGPAYFPPANGLVAPFIGTSEHAAILGLDTLEYLPAYALNSFISGEKIERFNDAKMDVRLGGTVLRADGKLFYSSYSSALSGPSNVYSGEIELIKLNQLAGCDNYGSNWIYFDNTKNQFIRYSLGAANCNPIPKGLLFDYAIDNNFPGGMKLVHLESITKNYSTSEIFSILKANESGKYYFARFNPTGTAQYNFDEIINAEQFEDATNFAVSPEHGYIFYTVGSKIYEYDFVLKRSFLMYDLGGRKISYFKFPFLNFSDVARWSSLPLNHDKYSAYRRNLVVGTYDDADWDSSGRLDVFNVPGVNHKISLLNSYSGMGKIVDLVYRER